MRSLPSSRTLCHPDGVRSLLALNAVVLGALFGSLGGLTAYRWAYGRVPACDQPVTKSTPFGRVVTCTSFPDQTPFVAAGVVLGIALLGLATWWLQRPSTRG